MDVLAALGDAPTAVIAVVAIVLGVVLAARGDRGERGQRAAAHGAADEMPPTLKVPIAAAEPATDADGLRKMASGEVGHVAIRLGKPAWRPAPVVEPPPQVQAPESQPEAAPESVEEPPAPAPHNAPSPSDD